MTISSINRRFDFIGNGATAVYPFTNMKIFSKTDLLVTQRDTDDTELTLTVDVDYTVTGVGDTAGGSITLTAGNLPQDYALTIRRRRPLTQNTDIRNQGDFFPEIHEDAFDHLIMVDQTQQEEIDRSMKLPETVTGVDITMPIPEALKLLRWNSSAAALESVDLANIVNITAVDASLTLTSETLSVTNPVLRAVAAGTVDAITATANPAPTSLVNNLTVLIEAVGANTTTTPTLDLNGLGAVIIVKGSGSALVAGDIPGANYRMELSYDAGTARWVLMNPYINRAGVVTLTGTETLTNKTLTTPTIASMVNANHTHADAAGGGVLTHSGLPVGAVVQVVNYQTGAYASGVTAIPVDDTIPQNTEGDEYMTLVITPKSATNKLLIQVTGYFSKVDGGAVTLALFQDTTAGALAVRSRSIDIGAGLTAQYLVSLNHYMTAGTVSATTFKVRAGTASGTIYFNGNSTTRLFGGALGSTITITEIKA